MITHITVKGITGHFRVAFFDMDESESTSDENLILIQDTPSNKAFKFKVDKGKGTKLFVRIRKYGMKQIEFFYTFDSRNIVWKLEETIDFLLINKPPLYIYN